jgi:competence protein ComEA
MQVVFIFLYHMWNQFIKDYLTFTKKERVAVLVLLALIFLVVILPYLWPAKKIIQPNKKEMKELQTQLAKLLKPDSSSKAFNEKEEGPAIYNRSATSNDRKIKAALFYFDPNTLSAEGWRRLGLKDKTIQTIQNYLSKGGKFRKPEDVGRIYGLFKNDYKRLLPYIKFENDNAVNGKANIDRKQFAAADKLIYPEKKRISLQPIDINSADTAALIALPGIGSKLAGRIINFREKLGGFYMVAQLAEIYGLPDSVFQKIQSLLQCSNPAVHQLNINTADVNILKVHPYIRWSIANAIVQYRTQHGSFKSVDDLQLISIITADVFQKIRPYLVIH